MPPPGASEKASQATSGDHWTPPTWSSSAVTGGGHPPETATVQTCGTPERFETKASCWPSGEKLGDEQAPTRAIRVTAVARSSAGAGAAAEAGTAPGTPRARVRQSGMKVRIRASFYSTLSKTIFP